MDSLVILREPVDRFISNFNYARIGSDMAQGAVLRLRGKHTAEFAFFKSAGSFVDALATPGSGPNASFPTQLAWNAVQKREGGVAFRKQSFWLRNTTRSRLHVVCYNASGIDVGVARVLRMAGSNCSVDALARRINRTGKYVKPNQTASVEFHNHATDAEDDALSPNQTAWVLEQYAEDAAMYRAHCEPKLPRIQLPQPLLTDPRWTTASTWQPRCHMRACFEAIRPPARM